MNFLPEYALVFLLAAILGFWLGRWMTRKDFLDASERSEDLHDAATRSNAKQWNKLWARFESLPETKQVDLTNVTNRLDGLAYAIEKLPDRCPVDLALVEGRIDDLNKIVRAILPPRAVNLAPIDERLGAVEAELARLVRRLDPAPQRDAAVPADPGA